MFNNMQFYAFFFQFMQNMLLDSIYAKICKYMQNAYNPLSSHNICKKLFFKWKDKIKKKFLKSIKMTLTIKIIGVN